MILLLTIEEFKKKAEPNFYNPVLIEFKFLETDYGFHLSGSAVSYESQLTYNSGDISISIFHAFLEVPALFLKRSVSGKIINEITIGKPIGASGRNAAKKLIKARNEMGIDEWCSNFRAGVFNDSMCKITHDYSMIVKNNIKKIMDGNFKLNL